MNVFWAVVVFCLLVVLNGIFLFLMGWWMYPMVYFTGQVVETDFAMLMHPFLLALAEMIVCQMLKRDPT